MPHDNGLSSASGLRWLYIDFNSYFASVEQQLRPELRGKPIAAVVPVETDATCAIAASYEAKAFGIKTKAIGKKMIINFSDILQFRVIFKHQVARARLLKS
jgi:nucleotidyltransferase/DNA polymerase involved in DNA repair